jgi:small subunit ribosomal protein SAe
MSALNSQDVQKLLAAQAHLGTRNMDSGMKDYVWRRRNDGVHIINVAKTLEKIRVAARMIAAVENPADVIVVSARPYAQRAVLKFATYTGAQVIEGRFTAGTFTNQITKQYREPRLLIVTDPLTDYQPVRESSYVNMPVIAFAHTDSPLRYVDCAIPANNKGRLSIGLIYWLLAREVLRVRGDLAAEEEWNVPVDLFFYRDPEELKALMEAEANKGETWDETEYEPTADMAASGFGLEGAEFGDAGNWQAPPAQTGF